ncbi:hypothetical protein GALMADRAFT_855848 [Galerina marginata CBS 339.88]|uniref:Uncharacterized protein n=1 Tax=Galerina marginata (strain CBS 339.88) TaxID=685588 RepID=A0A067TIA2_GALM3|nr:hypothetical protein GALMADRAFT_855848 [Galerina marginata CBS 339.88]
MPVDLTQSPSSALLKHNLSTIISIVQELVNKIPELRKRLLKTNRGVFATDLTLVAYGIRTGYLVDLITPNDPVVVFSSLIGALRADPRTKDYFASVLHLYEPSSEQSFFVNTSLLALCLNQFHATGDEPTARGTSSHRVLIPFFILLQSPVKIQCSLRHSTGFLRMFPCFSKWY